MQRCRQDSNLHALPGWRFSGPRLHHLSDCSIYNEVWRIRTSGSVSDLRISNPAQSTALPTLHILKLLTGFEPADTRSVVVCLILWTTGASYRMRDSNPRFRREKAMTYPTCRIRHSRQGEIRTLNVYHMGHGFTDRLLQPFAYLPRKWNGQKSNLRRLDLRPNALPTELPFLVFHSYQPEM